ncbi:MAG: hypothetical protein KGS44_13060, partial [Alphaproteobacteria bacterium]|nr:hypothetical protein [Alphaproteobacteria bacterium]
DGAVASVAPNPNSSFLPMLYPHILEKVALHAVSENRASPHFAFATAMARDNRAGAASEDRTRTLLD